MVSTHSQWQEKKFLFMSSPLYSILLINDSTQHFPILWTLRNVLARWDTVERRGLWGAVRGPRWIQILSSCNNIAHQWFVSERMREKDREREPRQSDSPSIFEALCHSSPLRLLHLIHSFHAALYDSLFTPTEHFDSLSHLIRQSVNLSLTPSLPPPIRTHPFFSHYSWIVLNAFSFTLLLFLCCTVTAIYLRHFLFKGIHSLSGQISLLLLPTFSQLIKKGQTIRKKKTGQKSSIILFCSTPGEPHQSWGMHIISEIIQAL